MSTTEVIQRYAYDLASYSRPRLTSMKSCLRSISVWRDCSALSANCLTPIALSGSLCYS